MNFNERPFGRREHLPVPAEIIREFKLPSNVKEIDDLITELENYLEQIKIDPKSVDNVPRAQHEEKLMYAKQYRANIAEKLKFENEKLNDKDHGGPDTLEEAA